MVTDISVGSSCEQILILNYLLYFQCTGKLLNKTIYCPAMIKTQSMGIREAEREASTCQLLTNEGFVR